MTTNINADPSSASKRPEWVKQIIIRQGIEYDLREMEWEGQFSRFRRVYADVYRRMEEGKANIWVAELPSFGLVGQALVQYSMHDKSCADGKKRGYLHSFRVRSAMRNYGIGSRLLAIVEQDLLARGFKEMTLNVAEDNQDAIRLYKRLDFEFVKRIPGRWSYYDEHGTLQHVIEPGYRLRKKLGK